MSLFPLNAYWDIVWIIPSVFTLFKRMYCGNLVTATFPTVAKGSEVLLRFLWPYLGVHLWRVSPGKRLEGLKWAFVRRLSQEKNTQTLFSHKLRRAHGRRLRSVAETVHRNSDTQQRKHFTPGETVWRRRWAGFFFYQLRPWNNYQYDTRAKKICISCMLSRRMLDWHLLIWICCV